MKEYTLRDLLKRFYAGTMVTLLENEIILGVSVL